MDEGGGGDVCSWVCNETMLLLQLLLLLLLLLDAATPDSGRKLDT
jgi:hypothetical protein